MKRDGFLPGDVLGAKTSTLPRSVPKSSMPRLAQWSQQQANKPVLHMVLDSAGLFEQF